MPPENNTSQKHKKASQAIPVRLVLTGPESSGKSSLAARLANHFSCPWAPEYARIFLEQQGPNCSFERLQALADQHLQWQRQHVPTDCPFGILDTDLINYKIWCEVQYGKCHPSILRQLHQEAHHVYLLVAPDLPWVADPLRKHPHLRHRLFELHREEIESRGRDFRIITGTGEERVRRGISAARELHRVAFESEKPCTKRSCP